MNNQPKVGDRVKLKAGEPPYGFFNPGDIGTVTKVDEVGEGFTAKCDKGETSGCHHNYWTKIVNRRQYRQQKRERLLAKVQSCENSLAVAKAKLREFDNGRT